MSIKLRIPIFFFWFLMCFISIWIPAITVYAGSDLYEQALTDIQNGDYDQALTVLEQLQVTDRKLALTGKLKLFLEVGDNENVVTTINALLQLTKDTIDLDIKKAIALQHLGELEQADDIISKIQSHVQKEPAQLVEIGRYYVWKQEYETALKYFNLALDIDPYYDDAGLGLAYYYVWKDNMQEAYRLADIVTINAPENINGLILKGWILAWQSKFEESLEIFEKALKIAPNHPEVIKGIAQSYAWDGQYSQSIEYYEHLLTIQKDNPDVLLQLARIYRKTNKFDSALEVLEQASEIDPERVDIREELEITQKWTSGVDNIIRDTRQRILLNRGNVEDFISLGKAYRWIGQLKKAKKAYQEALSKDPDNIQLLHALAQVHQNSNEFEQAKKIYNRILKLKPNFIDARTGLQEIKKEFRPSLLVQHNFDWYRQYDKSINSTLLVTRSHAFSVEYQQRLHSRYQLTLGYTSNRAAEIDKFFNVPDYRYGENTFYALNNISLPFNINVLGRYEFHIFENRKDDENFVNFTSTRFEHGGYLIVQAPYKFNNFSFQYARSYLPVIATDLELLKSDLISFSDDIEVNQYLSGVVSFYMNHNNFSQNWTNSYSIHPRFILPFFTQVSVEYDLTCLTNPTQFNHTGTVNFSLPIGSKIDAGFQYFSTYFSLLNNFSHSLSGTLNWNLLQDTNLSTSSTFTYYENNLTLNVLTSIMYTF